MYLRSRNRFLWLFRAKLFHSVVVLLLFLCHEDILTSKVKGHTNKLGYNLMNIF